MHESRAAAVPVLSAEQLLRGFFARLNDSSVTYVVLRDADLLPHRPSHDVDLLVAAEELDIAIGVLDTAAAQSGWAVIARMRKFEYCCSIVASGGDTPEFLPIDMVASCHFRGWQFGSVRAAFNGRRRTAAEVWTVSKGFEGAYVLAKDLLSLGEIRPTVTSFISSCANEHRVDFSSSLSEIAGSHLAQQLWTLSSASDWRGIAETRVALLRYIRLTQAFDIPRRARYWWKTLSYYAGPRLGLVAAVIGPDGSGKTTVADRLCADMRLRPFKRCSSVAMSFGILPRLGALVRGARAPSLRPSGVQHTNLSSLPVWRSAVLACWCAFDMALGRTVIWRQTGQGALLIFARYYYDYYFQPGHRNTPRWILRLFELVIAKPDVIFFIDRDADQIYRDKPELPLEEIREQQCRIRRLLKRLPNAKVLHGELGVDDTVEQARREVLRALSCRCQVG